MKKLVTFLILLLITSQILLVSAEIIFGMVLWLPMDEGSGDTVYDQSGEGNNGIIYGASWVDGKYGKALSFDGTNDYVDCGTGINPLSALSVSVWINPAIVGSYNQFIVGKTSGSSPYMQWKLGLSSINNALRVDLLVEGASFSAYWENAVPTTNIWYHTVFTFDGRYLTAYVNGTALTSSVDYGSTTSLNDWSMHCNIGYDIANTRYFSGIIDEVRVYNRALSPEEVLELYNYSPPANDYGNIGFYIGIVAMVIGLMAYLRSRH